MDLKLGRRDARFPVKLGAFATYGQLPAAPESWAGPADADFDYGMLGNDQYGDCGFAGFVHGFDADAILEGLPPFQPTTARVVSAYLQYTHGQDSGIVISELFHTLWAVGILGQKLDGYAPLRSGLDEMLSAVAVFGWTGSGVMVPAVARQQFAAGEPWDLTGTSADRNIVGGHFVVPVAFDQAAELVEVITWGRRQKVTFRWLIANSDEHWAPLTRMVDRVGHLDGFKAAQLQTDLRSLGGVTL